MTYEDMTIDEAVTLLRKWRENNERRSAEVLELWNDLLVFHVGNYGNESYLILEQVIFAALDCHADAIAKGCIYQLQKLFPGSLRVLRYKVAQLEAQEKYDEALEKLDTIINADETNAAARKRRVAIFIAQGQISEAIKELVDYLKKFMSDAEAWQQLCELYQRAGDYARAAFCAEELLLHQPHNTRHQQRVADIRYTMGGAENMELAKSYYCQALKLNPDNARARLGLALATNNLLTHYKSSGNANKRKEAAKLGAWAAGEGGLQEVMAALAITE